MFDVNSVVGKKFNRLTVIKFLYKKTLKDGKHYSYYYLCQCECGNKIEVCLSNLRGKHTKSCGCFKKENTSIMKTTHGLTNTRLYRIYHNILARCYNQKNISFERYGKRGIIVCEDWKKDFSNFYNWAMDNGYNDKLTIDRINNNGNYEPSNCRWATNKQQANNRCTSTSIFYDNKYFTISELATTYNLNEKCLRKRINNKWSIKKAISTPSMDYANKQYFAFGESHNLREWAKIKNINIGTLKSRIYRGWNIESALSITSEDGKKNTSLKKFITYNNETHCLSEWAKICKIPITKISKRLKRGWSIERALTTP